MLLRSHLRGPPSASRKRRPARSWESRKRPSHSRAQRDHRLNLGPAVGLGGAVLMTPLMTALLYGVGPMDPVTYAAVSIALAGVTLLATYLPARRGSQVQPMVALRSRV